MKRQVDLAYYAGFLMGAIAMAAPRPWGIFAAVLAGAIFMTWLPRGRP